MLVLFPISSVQPIVSCSKLWTKELFGKCYGGKKRKPCMLDAGLPSSSYITWESTCWKLSKLNTWQMVLCHKFMDTLAAFLQLPSAQRPGMHHLFRHPVLWDECNPYAWSGTWVQKRRYPDTSASTKRSVWRTYHDTCTSLSERGVAYSTCKVWRHFLSHVVDGRWWISAGGVNKTALQLFAVLTLVRQKSEVSILSIQQNWIVTYLFSHHSKGMPVAPNAPLYIQYAMYAT